MSWVGLEETDILSNHISLILCLGDKELRTQVFFCDILVVDDGERADTGQYEVLGDFICECFRGNEKDVCGSNSGQC